MAELAALTCVPLAGRCDHHRRVVWFAAAPALRARVTEAPTIRAITLPGPSSPPHRVAAQRDDTKLTRVTGNAPRGARIRVACRGRGCTYRREAIAMKLVRVGALQRPTGRRRQSRSA